MFLSTTENFSVRTLSPHDLSGASVQAIWTVLGEAKIVFIKFVVCLKYYKLKLIRLQAHIIQLETSWTPLILHMSKWFPDYLAHSLFSFKI